MAMFKMGNFVNLRRIRVRRRDLGRKSLRITTDLLSLIYVSDAMYVSIC